MALAGATLIRLGAPAGDGYRAGVAEADGPAPDEAARFATLRVSLRQAIYLTAADNFAREIRLLARPAGDPSPAGGTISQGQL